MLWLLGFVVLFALAMVAIYLLPAFVFRVLDWDDIRGSLLHRAYGSFVYDGVVIPGVRPSRGARLVIWALSRKDEGRRALVDKALAATDPAAEPRPQQSPELRASSAAATE